MDCGLYVDSWRRGSLVPQDEDNATSKKCNGGIWYSLHRMEVADYGSRDHKVPRGVPTKPQIA